ncbi:MAG: methyltransferase [Nitratiruptor sp.]|nr:methyltransferase [Nitratiruptor sp.]NPA83319.1 methyltransferase [Campylobacterota bacterium]
MIIYQPERGYCYNSDTIFLYHFVRTFPIRGRVLDVGSGSGILALLLKRDFQVEVSAIELQEDLARYARINAQANGLDIDVIVGDFLKTPFPVKFDYIVSNPPFYHEGVLRSQDPILDRARYSGYLPMDSFFAKAAKVLGPRGGLLFCYDAKQLPALMEALKRHKFGIEQLRFVHPKEERPASLVLIYARRNSKSLCRILPPLVVFAGSEYAPWTQEIFEEIGVHSIKCPIE